MNTEREIAPIVAQFVPVKLDIDSDEYREWRQDYASEGKTIPKLFVIRADGETLYGQSGSLKGVALPEMLMQALRHSGRILSAREVESLVATADLFEERQQAGDVAGAIDALGKLKKLGLPGKLGSYAAAAMRLDKLVLETIGEASEQLVDLESKIESDETPAKLNAILAFLEFKRMYSGLRQLKPTIAEFQKRLSVPAIRQLVREAKVIDRSRIAKTKIAKARSVKRLNDLIATTEIESVRIMAEKMVSRLESEPEKDGRKFRNPSQAASRRLFMVRSA